MRSVLRTLIVGVVCLSLAPSAGAAGRGVPTRRDLQRRADAAAVRYDRAVAELSRLGDEIGRLERGLADAEATMAPLRAAITRRAVTIYTSDRGLDAVIRFTAADDVLASGRAAKLTSVVSAGDDAVLRRVADVAAGLTRRRDELGIRRTEQQRAADDLQTERHSIEQALSTMVEREQREQALQSRLIPRASRSDAGVLQTLPPGPIPVVTDFVCPIRGPLTFTDTWGAPRPGGRRHEGTDLMNPYGTPNVAVVSGEFETHHSGLGGLSIYLHGDDGNTYYYAHLSQVVGPDRRVAQGELIGLTGSSGDAVTPHTHFEFHPGGGPAVDSYALVRAHC